MSFGCLDCKAINGGYCSDCATLNDDLRELAEEWAENANIDAGIDQYDAADRWEQAANQLEELIE